MKSRKPPSSTADADEASPRLPMAIVLGSGLLWMLAALCYVASAAAPFGEGAFGGRVLTFILGSLFAYQALAVVRGDQLAIVALRWILLLAGLSHLALLATALLWACGTPIEIDATTTPSSNTGLVAITFAGVLSAMYWSIWFGLRGVTGSIECEARG